MILADVDIRREMESGRLVVSPLCPDTIRENGLDLRIGDAPLPVGAERFTLACTAETITLPNNVVGMCNVRSTWARRGLLIPPTIIDAGFSGVITLEIVRLTERYEWVRPGERFLHVVLAYTKSPAVRPYRGKYQGQAGITGPRDDGEGKG